MIHTLVQQVCDSLGGIVGQIPFAGEFFTQVCTWLVQLLTGLGL